jgi:hypothetical protein
LQADSIFCCESNNGALSAAYEDLNLVQKFVIRNGMNDGRETGRKMNKERTKEREWKRKIIKE